MVRPAPIHAGDPFTSLPLAIGLLVSVSALVALCAKHAKQASRKYVAETTTDRKIAPRSPLRSPKQLITTISNKAIPFINHKKGGDEESGAEIRDKGEEEFGEGGLWQKEILMGEKCQPPEFSGVIYYDCYGHRISELPPRSPRASPLHNFSFPVVEGADC
ncbi:unnamed protein product [Ilex paraguariensis]|uniref:Uncharacterized protein n=1 Tax=Ilex paraguariensis TaxID=185542 RepID=A0ABC8RAW0_9AQUA